MGWAVLLLSPSSLLIYFILGHGLELVGLNFSFHFPSVLGLAHGKIPTTCLNKSHKILPCIPINYWDLILRNLIGQQLQIGPT